MDLSQNLLYFRKKRDFSLSQAAEALGLGTDILTGLEAGQLQPDAPLLSKFAQLYQVTVDDLYNRPSVTYDNFAQRLAAVFDSTRTPEDFALADNAFRQLIEQGSATVEDLRIYAQLQQTMMNSCLEQSLSAYTRIAQSPVTDDPAVRAARRQHMHLLLRIGQHTPELEAYLADLKENCSNPEEWLALISAFQDARRPEDALQWLKAAQARFPENAMFCYWSGTVCQFLDRWSQALHFWEQALQLDPEFTDAVYARAECLEKLGDLAGAAAVWQELAQNMIRRGLWAEAVYPKSQAARCRKLAEKT